ncbi:MAG: hypothetical protein ACFFFH_06980 [Candidatus Thorarchaeota archaeon]
MNGEGLLIIIAAFFIIVIIIISTRKSSKKHIQKGYELEQQGRHLDAFDYFARNSLEQAANLVLRTPEASQILVLRRLEKRYPLKQIEKVFLRIARASIERNDPHTAASAFVLAKKPFAAAKVFIDSGSVEDIPAAIQIIDRNISLIHNRDQAIRNLARHAYNSQKYMEAAELLRTIEADEEANAVIIAATTEMKKQGRVQEAEQFLATIRKPVVAIEQYLLEVKNHLKLGNIEKMRRSLAIAKDINEKLPLEEKNTLKGDLDSLEAAMTEYDRLLKILDSARDILRKKNTNQAIALYDELLESLGEETPTPILAEAALANEENDPQYAAKLFHRAALQAQSPRAAESFRLRAKKLEIIIEGQLSSKEKPLIDFGTEVEEFCSVCRMQITEPSTLIRCPDCGSPAHYTHLAEWLKIRGHCPICKKKIKIQRPKGVTF